MRTPRSHEGVARGRLRQLPQEVEPSSEVGGQREDDKEPDGFDRLHAEEIHLDAARARPRAQHQQQRREAQRQTERRDHRAAQRRRLEIHFRCGEEQHEPARDSLGERRRRQRVPERIPQRDHADQADAGQHQQDREHQWIVLRSTPAAQQVRHREGCEEPERRPSDRISKVGTAADDESRLQ